MIELIYDVNIPLVLTGCTTVESSNIEPIKEIKITGTVNQTGTEVEGLSVRFTIATHDEQEAIGIAENQLRHMKKVFYFEINKAIKWWNLSSVKDKNRNKNGEYVNFIEHLKVTDEVNLKLIYEHLDDLKESFSRKNQFQHAFVDLYINIDQIKGSIGKYIMTYSILSAIIGKQSKVDNFIKEHETNVEMRNSTRSDNTKKETIYTYLRNQIGHTENDVNVDNLEEEIRANLSKLSGFAKKAIINE